MPFLYDDEGSLKTEVPEGGDKALPLYQTEDGKTIHYDPTVPNTNLRKARDSAKTLRDEVAELKTRLQNYDGIEDPQSLVQELEEARKKLANANANIKTEGGNGEVDGERLNQLEQERDSLARKVQALEKDVSAKEQDLSGRDERIRRLSVGAAFKMSEMFSPYMDADGNKRSPRTLMEHEAAEQVFGRHFKVVMKDGETQMVATWTPTPDATDTIYSEKDPETPASFEEAIALLFNRWPRKNHYLPNDGPGGMGARESGGGGSGQTTISRGAFDKLSDGDKMAFTKRGGKIIDPAR